MKLLQLNISSLNTSVDELSYYQKENKYDAIFLQETNHIEDKSLGIFKNWKRKIHTTYTNKPTGFGVGTFIAPQQKNVFRNDLLSNKIEMIWNEMEINNKKTLIGNIYIPPGDINQLHALDQELEKHRDKNLILLGDFKTKQNKNKTWDKNVKHNIQKQEKF